MRKKRGRSEYEHVWEGGYVRVDMKGRRTFHIRTMIHGVRYHVSTRAHTESAALEQWARFQRNPSAYTPAGSSDPLPLDDDLIDEYVEWCEDEDEGKGNSPRWASAKRAYLEWWRDQLDGQDLRKVTVREWIAPALERKVKGKKPGARGHRIAVLKHLYTYLRTVRHSITAHEDPTFGALPIPQSDPRRRAVPDKAIPKGHYLAAREHLAGHWRDALDVLAGTGVHVTALVRFARDGSVEPYRGGEDAAGVLVFREKMHAVHRVAVSEPVRAAAERLLERGSLDRDKLDDAVRAACLAAGIPAHTPARYRHSVATWAIEAGADPALVAAFLGHRDARTTRRFYATHATPAKVPTLH